MYKYIILSSVALIVSPVNSIKEAQKRYGPLDESFKMVRANEWIVPFSFENFGLPYKTNLNKDLKFPMTMVMTELQETGLIKEIKDFKGCWSSRPIQGTERPSTHAYGLSCDFNHSKFSKEFVTVWKRWGFTWGGDFCSWKDWMHFSYGWEIGKCPYYRYDYIPKVIREKPDKGNSKRGNGDVIKTQKEIK